MNKSNNEGQVANIYHSTLIPNRHTLLFIHGLGDSSLSYLSFLNAPELLQYNILIPDLLGYGKSPRTNDYCFKNQISALIEQLNGLEKSCGFPFDNLVLISHSMGGIHAMLLCESEIKDKIKGCINVEGSITQYGSFISKRVTEINKKHQFYTWFNKFISQSIDNESYYHSLKLCDPNAFLQNALEIQQVCHASHGTYTNSAGKAFAELVIPKIYCYGDQSLCQESVNFLHENRIPTKIFHTNSHFIMQTCFSDFSQFIVEWMKNL